MAINVLCPGCKARFTVSDKFAGKKGPCPKCKTQISIPDKPTEEVKVHAPEAFGPKTAEGKAVLQPIFREERKFSQIVAAAIGGGVVLVLILALILRFSTTDKTEFPTLVLALGAVLLAPPLAYGGYLVMRDEELQPHQGQELYTRVAICSAIHAGIWGLLWGLIIVLPFGDMTQEIYFIAVAFGAMLLLGAGGSFVSLDLNFGKGIFHYGLYLLVTVLLRLVIGLAPLIGPFKD